MVDADIEAAITGSASAWDTFVDANRASPGGYPLAVKYVPSKYAKNFRVLPNDGLFIGRSNFTWGQGIYVTGVEEWLSTAIYGRAGVVSSFDPVGWRAFDARDQANVNLYLRWLHFQPDYPDAVLTVHSNHWLHELRNTFREQFDIDVVLFNPDERDLYAWYTNPTHTWLAVSDWQVPGQLSEQDFSLRFRDVRLTIVAEEEFEPDEPALIRSPQFALSGVGPVAATDARQAYLNHQIIRVAS
ncbi:hypothetical protein [Mycobacterium sp.]|uniref:hypothetical protein n=1 Tax=Mycobacterium sp. TaxID=1785 RepID=UPI003F9DA19E